MDIIHLTTACKIQITHMAFQITFVLSFESTFFALLKLDIIFIYAFKFYCILGHLTFLFVRFVLMDSSCINTFLIRMTGSHVSL